MFARGSAPALLSALLLVACVSGSDSSNTVAADDLHENGEVTPTDPRGIYLNTFSGGFAGSEWFEVRALPGATDRFVIADVFGGGFEATFRANGEVLVDGTVGSGRRANADRFVLDLRIGGRAFAFDSTRVASTTSAFPLTLDTRVDGDPALAGAYRCETEELDPRSGAVGTHYEESLQVSVDGPTFRFTDPSGLYFQGVFIDSASVAFRALTPEPSDVRFRSFDGSTLNFAQNMLGTATLAGDTWTATILLQSRAALGSQKQRLLRFSARRAR